MTESLPLVRDLVILPSRISVAEARQRVPRKWYGIVVDDEGVPLTCLVELAYTTKHWPSDKPLAALVAAWPKLITLPEAEATGLAELALFFENELAGAPGILLVDAGGKPSAMLPTGQLLAALPTRKYVVGSTAPEPSLAHDDLMVTRYGLLRAPAQVPLQQPCSLSVAINREKAGGKGEVELGLRAADWPLHVVASLVNVRPTDFLVVGTQSGVIVVPRMANSDALIFTLIPQCLGPASVRVRFEQDGMYLGTAILSLEVVADVSSQEDAEVQDAPVLSSGPVAPDLVLYVEQDGELSYTVSALKRGDLEARRIDRITFPSAPDRYLEEIFYDLDTATTTGLAPDEFAAEVKKIGVNLFNLFHEDGFKSFYWQEMAGRPSATTVLIVSDEPYIPWELLRPTRELPDGSWQTEELFLCERFVVTRWLAGPGLVTQVPLASIAAGCAAVEPGVRENRGS